MVGLNPFKTLPKDGTARGTKDMQNRSTSGSGYSDGGQSANYRGNYRGGRGGGFTQHRGNMHANQGGGFGRGNFSAGGNMGGGYNNQMFNNPMGGGNFGFNRGGMMNMGGMQPRGGGNMRGGRGGMGGNMMGMNPMGGMPNPMAGMGMMGGGMQGTYDFSGLGHAPRPSPIIFGVPFQKFGSISSCWRSDKPSPSSSLHTRQSSTSRGSRSLVTSHTAQTRAGGGFRINNIGPFTPLDRARTKYPSKTCNLSFSPSSPPDLRSPQPAPSQPLTISHFPMKTECEGLTRW